MMGLIVCQLFSYLTGCDAVGLRYKNDSTGNYRGVKISTEGDLMEPQGGWGSRLYTVVTKDAGAGSQFLDSSYSQPPSSDDPFTAVSSVCNDGVQADSKSQLQVKRERIKCTYKLDTLCMLCIKNN